MRTRVVNNFAEYVAFIADHVSDNWRGYTKKDADPKLRLEEIFGEPKSYPCNVGVEHRVPEDDERGMSQAFVGFVSLKPVINSFL
jgi:hypothetical protein